MYTNPPLPPSPPPLHMREKINYEAVKLIKMKVGGFTRTGDYYI